MSKTEFIPFIPLSPVEVTKEIIEKTVYPDDITNREMYHKYLAYNIPWEKAVGRYRAFGTSIPDVTVDLLQPFMNFRPILAKLDLSEKEREYLEQQKKYMAGFFGRMNGFLAKSKVNKGLVTKRQDLNNVSREIIQMMGKYYSLKEIIENIYVKHEIKLEETDLEPFRRDHADAIAELQKVHREDFGDLRLSHKKSRLEELQELYADRKRRYLRSGTALDYRLLLQTIKAISDEAEVDVLRIEGAIDHRVEHTINLHVQQEIFKGMTINDIIIGRVAAQQGVNAAFLIERLHNSFYAKHSGFNKHTNHHAEKEDAIYPSTIVYNWDLIKQQHTPEQQEQRKREMRVEEIQDAEVVEEAKALKDVLMAKIIAKREKLNNNPNNVS